MKQAKTTTILMLASLLALAVFLVFWLRSEYRTAAEVMTERGNFLYQEAVREVQDSVYEKFIFQFVSNAQDSTRTYADDIFGLRSGGRIDTVIQQENRQLRIETRESTTLEWPSTLRLHITKDSLATQGLSTLGDRFPESANVGSDTLVFFEDLNQLTRFGTTTPTRGDDLRAPIRSIFEAGLRAAELPLAYELKATPTEAAEDLDFFPGRFDTYLSETVVFTDAGWYLARQTAGAFAFSSFLFLLTLLAFWSLRRSSLRALQYSRLKGDFMSNMTHELKTPITTVGLAVEAMQGFVQNNQRDKLAEYLTISKHELSRLSLLVDKVLKLSLFENEVASLKKEPVDLKELFYKVKDAMSIQLEQSGGTLDWRISGDDFRLSGDPVHLGNVLFNLLDNAQKYAGEAPPRIEVDLRSDPEAVTIAIRDHGVGIPAAYQNKVFDRFFRVPQTGDRHNVKGYGLGLSYVADIVRRHGGEVKLQSREGGGATFTIELPN